MCMCVCMQLHAYDVWKPEVNDGCLPQVLSTSAKKGFSLNRELTGQQPRDLPMPTLPALELWLHRASSASPMGAMVLLESLLFVQQALLTEPLPQLLFLLFCFPRQGLTEPRLALSVTQPRLTLNI